VHRSRPGLDIRDLKGLSDADAAERLRTEGFNELPSSRPRNLLALAWASCANPCSVMLASCGAIYLVLGDAEEALMLMGFVAVVMGITLHQQRKSERHSRRCAISRARALRSSATAGRNVWPAVRSCAATC